MLPYLARLAHLCGLRLVKPARTPAVAASRLRILVVESEPLFAAELQQNLLQLGYAACAAGTHAEAVEIARQSLPDIALIDIGLQAREDGIDTAQQLARQFDTAIIFFTAHTDSGTLERANRVNPYGVLPRPISACMLRSTIELAAHTHMRTTGRDAGRSGGQSPAAVLLRDRLNGGRGDRV